MLMHFGKNLYMEQKVFDLIELHVGRRYLGKVGYSQEQNKIKPTTYISCLN